MVTVTGADWQTQILDAELVVISDVHLRSQDDDRTRLLIDSIDRIDPSHCRFFVLTGDIFDFCLGDRLYFRQKFERLEQRLTRLAAAGTRVLFVEGNHEFQLSSLRWEGVTFITGDYIIQLPTGRRVKICHGDVLAAPRQYLWFRHLAKSKFASRCARVLSPAVIDRLGLRFASHSRGQDGQRELDHARVLHAAYSWLDDSEVDDGIIGHFHIPYAEPRPGKGGRLLSVDSWDKPNLLALRKDDWYRAHLDSRGGELSLTKVAPFLGAT